MNSGFPHSSSSPEAQELQQLQTQLQRSARNINIDGSFDLGWGISVLCGGLVPYFNAALPAWIMGSAWLNWVCYLPLACMALAPYAIPKTIKRLITWPRTGYVTIPGEVKLKQLLLLMLFGGTLGLALGSALVLATRIPELMNGSAGHPQWSPIMKQGLTILFCTPLVIFLWPRVITKRKPLPTAYDTGLLGESPFFTASLKRLQAGMMILFFAVPLLFGGLVFWLAFASRTALHRVEIHWPQLAMISFMAVTNAALFLMGNGAMMKQHKWKWVFSVLLLLAPFVVAFTVPYAAANRQPVLELLPPPVTLCFGLIWVTSGMLTLVSFTHHNPMPSREPA